MRNSMKMLAATAATCVAVLGGLAHAQSGTASSTTSEGTPGLSADRGNPSGAGVQRPDANPGQSNSGAGNRLDSRDNASSSTDTGRPGLSADRGNPSGAGIQRPDANPGGRSPSITGASNSAGVNADGTTNNGAGGAILDNNAGNSRPARQDRN